MATLAQILHTIHTSPSTDAYVSRSDDRLIISLLLAVASGHRNLLLRVTPAPTQISASPPDLQHLETLRREAVARVANEVAWLCAYLFALTSHRVACSSRLSATAFLRSLFPPLAAPEPIADLVSARNDSAAPRPGIEATRTTPRRSLTGPLEVSTARANEGALVDLLGGKVDFLTAPGPPTSLVPTSAPASRLSFSDLTGPSPHDGESSAGEDLYPSLPRTTSSLGRRATLSPRLQGSPSPDRTRNGARRHTLGERDLGRSVPHAHQTIGLGFHDQSAAQARSVHPFSPPGRASSGYFTPRATAEAAAAALAHGHASYLQQADRRPSIASIQAGASNPSPVTPSTSAQLSSSVGCTGPSSPRVASLAKASSSSPLAHSSAPAAAGSPASSPPSSPVSPTTPIKRSSPRRLPRHASSTYPPVSRRPSAAAQMVGIPSGEPVPERVLPRVLILEHLERARPSAQQALLGVLRDRRVVLRGSSAAAAAAEGPPAAVGGPRSSNPYTPSPASARRKPSHTGTTATGEEEEGTSVGVRGRDGGIDKWDGTWNLPDGFLCVAIVWDDGEEGEAEEGTVEGAQRRDGGWGGVSRYLLDRFNLSYTVPPTLLLAPSRYSAPPAPPVAPTTALVAPVAIPDAALPSYVSDALDTYLSDLVSALRHHPRLDGRMLTAAAVRDLRRLTRVWAAMTKGEVLALSSPTAEQHQTHGGVVGPLEAEAKNKQANDPPDVLVLPADVLAVVVSVLGHRLALRNPRDEKSLFWGSDLRALRARRKVVDPDSGTVVQSLSSVHQILKEVVAIV